MITAKRTFFIICATTIVTLLVTFIKGPGFQLIPWLNMLFISSLIFIVSGSIIRIFFSGVFTRFRHNFTHFFKNVSKARIVADELERKKLRNKGEDIKESKSPVFVTSVLFSGVIMASISIILSFMVSA